MNTATLCAGATDWNTHSKPRALLDGLPGSFIDTGDGDWLTRFDGLLGSYAELLFAYPGPARAALILRPTGKNALALFDRALGLLLESDVEPDRAACGVDLLCSS